MKLDANPNRAPFDMSAEEQQSMETGFGKFLRKTSIDETPQLFNIFVGQMAFVGPRPGAAINEEELVIAREKYIPSAFAVKPGLGGLAQTRMKRDHSPELKAKYDSQYAKELSFPLDFRLFIGTFLRVFKSGAR